MKKHNIIHIFYLTLLASFCITNVAWTQNLVADYRFDGTLSSAVGEAADLDLIGEPGFETESVDGIDQQVLTFGAGEGCRLLNASQTLGQSYTIAVLFRFDSISSWRRVIDFRNRKTDWGLYSYFGNLNFYNIFTGTGGAIEPDAYVQIVLTRNGQGTVRGYVNGLSEIDFNDSSQHAILDTDDILSFFQDDVVVANEHAAGAVSRIRLWDGALSEQVVANLDRSPIGSTTVPPTISSALEISVGSGEQLDYTLTAINDPTSFSVTDLQSWMTFDVALGKLTGTANTPGVYEVGISASNAGGSDSKVLRVTVTPATGSSVGFKTANIRVPETAGEVDIQVLRQGDSDRAVSLNYMTQDGTALAGAHYVTTSGTLDFADGEDKKTITLEILKNEEDESEKKFKIVLSSPVNTVIAQPSELQITVEDVPVPDVEFAISSVIRWQSVAGVRYRVIWSLDLDAGTWKVFKDNIIGTGDEMVVLDPITYEHRFYRVELEE